MRVLLILFLLVLYACQSSQGTKNKSEVSPEKERVPAIPQFVEDYLKTNLQGWQLAERSDWADSSFRKHTDTPDNNYILSDINCDDKPDFTGVLKNSSGQYATFQIYSLGQYYISKQLETYPDKKPLKIGLRLLDAKLLSNITTVLWRHLVVTPLRGSI
jgi:hypothetical protein